MSKQGRKYIDKNKCWRWHQFYMMEIGRLLLNGNDTLSNITGLVSSTDEYHWFVLCIKFGNGNNIIHIQRSKLER